ncbi:hypothetical protein [Mesonia sp. HuA40]|uniref:hypothetical protein n=1 Tax=Mesonia sp. HuA40 TaxID=2602761 RepID=UPI0011CBF395|nr:hypothetical protein [Mesonia sp. HuA40]TXK74601.1 hypothetical protein FT993_01790 [Mesonia sp. HuA40]
MKNFKNYLQISLLLLIFSSCSSDPAVEDNTAMEIEKPEVNIDNNDYENQSESEISIYEIERPYYDEATDQEINILFTIGISEEDDDLHFFDISDNILELKGITKAELEAELINVANGDGDDDDDPNDGLTEHAGCIEACKDKYEKNEGRGGCKAACWVDTTVRVIEAIFPF